MFKFARKTYHKIYDLAVSIGVWLQTLYYESSTIPPDVDSPGKIVGFTCGAFDLLHAGHVLMLKEAKTQCDHLIVGLHYDPSVDRPGKNRPVQTYAERTILLESIQYVDEVVFYETEADLLKLLKRINPDVRIIGADWRGKQFTGHELPIKIYVNSRDHHFSTAELRERVFISELRKRSVTTTPE